MLACLRITSPQHLLPSLPAADAAAGLLWRLTAAAGVPEDWVLLLPPATQLTARPAAQTAQVPVLGDTPRGLLLPQHNRA